MRHPRELLRDFLECLFVFLTQSSKHFNFLSAAFQNNLRKRISCAGSWRRAKNFNFDIWERGIDIDHFDGFGTILPSAPGISLPVQGKSASGNVHFRADRVGHNNAIEADLHFDWGYTVITAKLELFFLDAARCVCHIWRTFTDASAEQFHAHPSRLIQQRVS